MCSNILYVVQCIEIHCVMYNILCVEMYCVLHNIIPESFCVYKYVVCCTTLCLTIFLSFECMYTRVLGIYDTSYITLILILCYNSQAASFLLKVNMFDILEMSSVLELLGLMNCVYLSYFVLVVQPWSRCFRIFFTCVCYYWCKII